MLKGLLHSEEYFGEQREEQGQLVYGDPALYEGSEQNLRGFLAMELLNLLRNIGQSYGKAATPTRCALHDKFATMQLHEVPANGEAKTDTLTFAVDAGLPALLEGGKYSLEIIFLNADSRIFDENGYFAGTLAGAKGDRSRGRGVFHGVVYQIIDHLPKPMAIRPDRFGDADLADEFNA